MAEQQQYIEVGEGPKATRVPYILDEAPNPKGTFFAATSTGASGLNSSFHRHARRWAKSKELNVVIVDSPNGLEGYVSADQFGAAVTRVFYEQTQGPVLAMGHSIGAHVLLNHMARNRKASKERVKAAVLSSTAVNAFDMLRYITWPEQVESDPELTEDQRAHLRGLHAKYSKSKLLRLLAYGVAKHGELRLSVPGVWQTQLGESFTKVDPSQRLSTADYIKIGAVMATVPTLFLHGGRDAIAPIENVRQLLSYASAFIEGSRNVALTNPSNAMAQGVPESVALAGPLAIMAGRVRQVFDTPTIERRLGKTGVQQEGSLLMMPRGQHLLMFQTDVMLHAVKSAATSVFELEPDAPQRRFFAGVSWPKRTLVAAKEHGKPVPQVADRATDLVA